MFNTAFAPEDAVQHGSNFDLWRCIGVEAGPVIVDLKTCREKVSPPRKTVKDTRERWFGVQSMATSVIGKAAPCLYPRISDVQYIDEHHKLGFFCCS